jgi:tRNA-splicing ligase RtcB
MPERFDDVLSWAVDLEEEARQQALRTAALPFVVKPLVLMPDAHFGLGATIGSVIATKGAIIPAAVGVDIGCGMVAVRTQFTSAGLPDNLDGLHHQISRSIPSGVGRSFRDDVARHASLPTYDGEMTEKQERTARTQLGTLGSGNHFIEVCLDEADRVWLVLHSGSRGIGNQLATQHINKAKGLMKEWSIQLADPDLAYLPESTPEWSAYIYDMRWAQRYATANRQVMMSAVIDQLGRLLGEPVTSCEQIDCHHNFTEL